MQVLSYGEMIPMTSLGNPLILLVSVKGFEPSPLAPHPPHAINIDFNSPDHWQEEIKKRPERRTFIS